SAGALTGAVLFGLFAAWSAVTLLWSVAPNQTWLELNRELGYLIVLLLAIALGSSHARAVEWLCHGFLAAALLVTAYALGQKLLPGLHIPGVLDLDHTGPLPRLQEPLGYWNALALFIALAVPIALATAVDRSRRLRLRLGATAAVAAMLLTIVLTYSRGGLLALAIGLAVGMALSGARLGWALWLAAGVLAAVPAAVFGLSFGDLTRVGVSLGHREVAGAFLLLILVASLGALVLLARRLPALESRVRLAPERAARLRRRGSLVGAVAVVCVVAVLVATGVVSDVWHSFTATRVPARGLALVALTLWLCLFGLSAELPELAASKASRALVLASESPASALAAAQSSAAEATRLDPLSDAGLLVEVDLAQHRGRLRAARALLGDALERDPTDLRAWEDLAFVDLELRDRRGVAQAERRLVELDPRGRLARALAQLRR
ncbi:MAG TPA: O-antigen ligase family protein, partial [Candidatus Limnocylindria bacterium]|nr:O-antigen ligase family protein [Candidatus Limnocylindria bacterium]